MTKVIILSIRPEHAVNILKGFKTEELRKSVPKDFVGWVYIYVSRGKDRLSVVHDDEICKTYYYLNSIWGRELNGEVVARFWFDEYDTYYWNEYQGDYRLINKGKDIFRNATMSYEELCLNEEEVNNYGKGKLLYTWHIKHLEVFDKPMQLIDFVSDKLVIDVCGSEFKCYSETASYFARKDQRLTKAPQSYQYVWVKEEVSK